MRNLVNILLISGAVVAFLFFLRGKYNVKTIGGVTLSTVNGKVQVRRPAVALETSPLPDQFPESSLIELTVDPNAFILY